MQGIGLGAGLAALGFWAFVAAIIVAGMWYARRTKDAEQETLRRLIESGQQVDPAVLDKLIAASGGNRNVARDLTIAAMIVLFTAPGLAVLGLFLSVLSGDALYPLLGSAALLLCVGGGLYVAARLVRRDDAGL